MPSDGNAHDVSDTVRKLGRNEVFADAVVETTASMLSLRLSQCLELLGLEIWAMDSDDTARGTPTNERADKL